MTHRRPLIHKDGTLHELPPEDTLALALPDDDTTAPTHVAVKQNGVWRQLTWAAFAALLGTVTPPPPSGTTVTVNGETVTCNGEIVTVNATSTPEAVLVGGEAITVNGVSIEVTT